MAKKNAFLENLKKQAQEKESAKTKAHVEIDTMALLFSTHDVCKVGSGRASTLLNSFLAYKMEIAEEIIKELDEDQSKKKEIVKLRRDLAARLKEILGKDGWEEYKILFPFCRDYWEW